MGIADRLRRAFSGAPEPAAEPDAPQPASMRERQRRDKEAAKPARPQRRVTRIRRDVLEMMCEAARESHPNEFGASMRAEGDTVTELIFVPGTIGGESHAILPLGMLPVDFSIVGTIHSHPGPWAIPSDADKELFRNFGHTHIIIAEPYTVDTWIAYDQAAREIELEIVES